MTTVKTQVGELIYIFIEGEGRNQAMEGNPERMMYVCSIRTPANSKLHKHMEAQIDKEWDAYKKANGLKPAQKPKTNGIKAETDKETGEETGNVLITFKTDVAWPDGKKKVIQILDHKGRNITEGVHAADWLIGNGSTGIIHGVAEGNNTGGAHKVSLYLKGVQIAKLVKYEGEAIDAEEIDGEDIDVPAAISTEDQSETTAEKTASPDEEPQL